MLHETEEMKAKAQISHAQPDDLIDFYHLKSRRFVNLLTKVVQLTFPSPWNTSS
jgi:hypothetical protein